MKGTSEELEKQQAQALLGTNTFQSTSTVPLPPPPSFVLQRFSVYTDVQVTDTEQRRSLLRSVHPHHDRAAGSRKLLYIGDETHSHINGSASLNRKNCAATFSKQETAGLPSGVPVQLSSTYVTDFDSNFCVLQPDLGAGAHTCRRLAFLLEDVRVSRFSSYRAEEKFASLHLSLTPGVQLFLKDLQKKFSVKGSAADDEIKVRCEFDNNRLPRWETEEVYYTYRDSSSDPLTHCAVSLDDASSLIGGDSLDESFQVPFKCQTNHDEEGQTSSTTIDTPSAAVAVLLTSTAAVTATAAVDIAASPESTEDFTSAVKRPSKQLKKPKRETHSTQKSESIDTKNGRRVSAALLIDPCGRSEDYVVSKREGFGDCFDKVSLPVGTQIVSRETLVDVPCPDGDLLWRLKSLCTPKHTRVDAIVHVANICPYQQSNTLIFFLVKLRIVKLFYTPRLDSPTVSSANLPMPPQSPCSRSPILPPFAGPSELPSCFRDSGTMPSRCRLSAALNTSLGPPPPPPPPPPFPPPTLHAVEGLSPAVSPAARLMTLSSKVSPLTACVAASINLHQSGEIHPMLRLKYPLLSSSDTRITAIQESSVFCPPKLSSKKSYSLSSSEYSQGHTAVESASTFHRRWSESHLYNQPIRHAFGPVIAEDLVQCNRRVVVPGVARINHPPFSEASVPPREEQSLALENKPDMPLYTERHSISTMHDIVGSSHGLGNIYPVRTEDRGERQHSMKRFYTMWKPEASSMCSVTSTVPYSDHGLMTYPLLPESGFTETQTPVIMQQFPKHNNCQESYDSSRHWYSGACSLPQCDVRDEWHPRNVQRRCKEQGEDFLVSVSEQSRVTGSASATGSSQDAVEPKANNHNLLSSTSPESVRDVSPFTYDGDSSGYVCHVGDHVTVLKVEGRDDISENLFGEVTKITEDGGVPVVSVALCRCDGTPLQTSQCNIRDNVPLRALRLEKKAEQHRRELPALFRTAHQDASVGTPTACQPDVIRPGYHWGHPNLVGTPFSISPPRSSQGILCFFWDLEATGLNIGEDDITQIACICRRFYFQHATSMKQVTAPSDGQIPADFRLEPSWECNQNLNLPFNHDTNTGVVCFDENAGPTCASKGRSEESEEDDVIGLWEPVSGFPESEFNCYVYTDRPIPKAVVKLTGITNAFLDRCERALAEWTRWVLSARQQYQDCPVWFVAHNGNRYDLPLLFQQEVKKLNQPPGTFLQSVGTAGIVDTVVLSRRLPWDSAPPRRSHKLQSLYKDVFQADMPNEHDALALLMEREPFLSAWRRGAVGWPLSEYLSLTGEGASCYGLWSTQRLNAPEYAQENLQFAHLWPRNRSYLVPDRQKTSSADAAADECDRRRSDTAGTSLSDQKPRSLAVELEATQDSGFSAGLPVCLESNVTCWHHSAWPSSGDVLPDLPATASAHSGDSSHAYEMTNHGVSGCGELTLRTEDHHGSKFMHRDDCQSGRLLSPTSSSQEANGDGIPANTSQSFDCDVRDNFSQGVRSASHLFEDATLQRANYDTRSAESDDRLFFHRKEQNTRCDDRALHKPHRAENITNSRCRQDRSATTKQSEVNELFRTSVASAESFSPLVLEGRASGSEIIAHGVPQCSADVWSSSTRYPMPDGAMRFHGESIAGELFVDARTSCVWPPFQYTESAEHLERQSEIARTSSSPRQLRHHFRSDVSMPLLSTPSPLIFPSSSMGIRAYPSSGKPQVITPERQRLALANQVAGRGVRTSASTFSVGDSVSPSSQPPPAASLLRPMAAHSTPVSSPPSSHATFAPHGPDLNAEGTQRESRSCLPSDAAGGTRPTLNTNRSFQRSKYEGISIRSSNSGTSYNDHTADCHASFDGVIHKDVGDLGSFAARNAEQCQQPQFLELDDESCRSIPAPDFHTNALRPPAPETTKREEPPLSQSTWKAIASGNDTQSVASSNRNGVSSQPSSVKRTAAPKQIIRRPVSLGAAPAVKHCGLPGHAAPIELATATTSSQAAAVAKPAATALSLAASDSRKVMPVPQGQQWRSAPAVAKDCLSFPVMPSDEKEQSSQQQTAPALSLFDSPRACPRKSAVARYPSHQTRQRNKMASSQAAATRLNADTSSASFLSNSVNHTAVSTWRSSRNKIATQSSRPYRHDLNWTSFPDHVTGTTNNTVFADPPHFRRVASENELEPCPTTTTTAGQRRCHLPSFQQTDPPTRSAEVSSSASAPGSPTTVTTSICEETATVAQADANVRRRQQNSDGPSQTGGNVRRNVRILKRSVPEKDGKMQLAAAIAGLPYDGTRSSLTHLNNVASEAYKQKPIAPPTVIADGRSSRC